MVRLLSLSFLPSPQAALTFPCLSPSLSRGFLGILAWLGLLLTKQKKNDFKPKNDDISFERVNTEPCLVCVDVLDRVREAAREGLSGKNAEGFLTEVGVGFHKSVQLERTPYSPKRTRLIPLDLVRIDRISLLLDHLKKFPVSVTGALMLTKDLALYQESISLFSLPPLNDRFSMLRQLGNLFVVQPEVLKSFMKESYLARIQTPLLRPYLMQRVDWGTFSKRFAEEEGFGVDPSAAGTGGAASAEGPRGVSWDAARTLGRTGLSRLGGLMKDYEGFSVGTSGAHGSASGTVTPVTGGGMGDRRPYQPTGMPMFGGF